MVVFGAFYVHGLSRHIAHFIPSCRMPLPPFAHFPAAGPYGPMNPMLALATANGLYGHGGHGGPGHPRGGPGRGGGGGSMRGGMSRGFDNGNWGEEFTKLLPHLILD